VTVVVDPVEPDPAGAQLVLGAGALLGAFNQVGVLVPADLHVAARLARLGDDHDEAVALAVALAVRGPRYGHVYVDLATIRGTAADVDEDVDLDALPWPDPEPWVRRLAASPLVAVGEDGPADRPLRLTGTALYLDRYWRDERAVAADLAARSARPGAEVAADVLAAGLLRLFPGDGSADQRAAAATAVLRPLTVIAGGPGSGKTTTVARVLALLDEQATAQHRRPPLVALAAPTGKAAARLEEAVHADAPRLDVASDVRARLLATRASTLHRLLGRLPDSSSRFRYDRHNRLPHDVLVVDETSMVSLSLMARLVEAVRADARLILVGDPEQLASVEAGAVLGDIVGPAQTASRMSPQARRRLAVITGTAPPPPSLPPASPGGPSVGDGIVVLRSNYRFTGRLADLAGAIRQGDGDRVIQVLSSGEPAVRWLAVDDDIDPARLVDTAVLEPVRAAATATGAALLEASAVGDGGAALAALNDFRVLCAHRRGPAGVSAWTPRIEEWLGAALDGFDATPAWYLGRPVIVTANDYSLRLFNGDTGVVVARPDGGVGVVFRRGDALISVSPSRLAAVDTVFAMTVHKAQGSEFRSVAILLPPPSSPVLSRELLYTAVTRAQERVLVAGSEASLRAAVARPIARASGLTARLWEAPG
jgi:exodeoxyribonuclease V alpha subunit